MLADHGSDKKAEHGACQFKIKHFTLGERADNIHIGRSAADHPVRFRAKGNNMIGFPVHGNNRRLTEDNPPTLHINNHIGSTEINRDIVRLSHDAILSSPSIIPENHIIIR